MERTSLHSLHTVSNAYKIITLINYINYTKSHTNYIAVKNGAMLRPTVQKNNHKKKSKYHLFLFNFLPAFPIEITRKRVEN